MAKDEVRAHMWFSLAATRLPASKTENRDKSAHNRDIAAVCMTSAQIAEVQKLAREWRPK